MVLSKLSPSSGSLRPQPKDLRPSSPVGTRERWRFVEGQTLSDTSSRKLTRTFIYQETGCSWGSGSTWAHTCHPRSSHLVQLL